MGDTLPYIVIERLDETGPGKIVAQRSLLTPHQLKEESSLWTVESRLIDSLGTMSRDLGRDISLNEFLIALAPEHTSLRYSPLVPDVPLFKRILWRSHRPARAQFSLEHRQSAIRWEQRTVSGDEEDVDVFPAADDLRAIGSTTARVKLARLWSSGYSSGDFPLIATAPISGETSEVMAVIGRSAIVLRPDTFLEKLWQLLRAAIDYLDRVSCSDDVENKILQGVCAFVLCVTQRSTYRLDSTWGMSISELRRLAAKLEIEVDLPDEINRYVKKRWVFNASRMWVDWYGGDGWYGTPGGAFIPE